MSINRIFIILLLNTFLSSCVNYEYKKTNTEKTEQMFSSSGFVLVYNRELYKKRVVNKSLNNQKLYGMHNFLKLNTTLKLYNPENSKTVNIKIKKKANYPNIYSLVISKEVANALDLNLEDPFLDIVQLKINKKFVAKNAKIFDEEKKVSDTAPVKSVEINDISNKETLSKVKKIIHKSFVIHISDFYYLESAENLKKRLHKKGKIDNLSIIKVSKNKFRLTCGPFKNFSSLKNTYTSLNNLGFDELNIYKK